MAHDLLTLLGDIEDAFVQRLSGSITGIQEFNITTDLKGVRCPAVNVALYDGTFRPLGPAKYRCDATFMVTLVVANPSTSLARRRAVYPLLMAAVQLLGHWRPVLVEGAVTVDLGAKETQLSRFRKVLEESSLLAYSAELKTNFGFTIPADETLGDVLTIGLSTMLKAGDDVADGQDVVDVELPN